MTLRWTTEEKTILSDPAVQFNPPIRFLQTSGHKSQIGINYDKTHLKVVSDNAESEKKLKHLVRKLVISPEQGLGATASYGDVFKDYGSKASSSKGGKGQASASAGAATSQSSANSAANGNSDGKLKKASLFAYPVTISGALVKQLMKEAKDLNCKNFPAAGVFLLRNILEAILKDIIHKQNANTENNMLDLERSINICMSNKVNIGKDYKAILKEFHSHHLSYLNLGSHGNTVPNYDRVMAVRDCVDQFVKKYV